VSISSSLDGWGIQDIGHDHVHALGFDKTHPVGVVRRTMVDLIRPIEFQDMLRLRRWCSGTSTRWCEIRVRIDGGAGGLIESEAFWININRDTGMPSRLSDDFLDELQRTTDVHRLRWTATARTPSRSANTQCGSPTLICSTT
jgi:acyl-ACP thioesterase